MNVWGKTQKTVAKITGIDVVLVFLLITLNIFHTFFCVSIADFEQVNGTWEETNKYVTKINFCIFDITAFPSTSQ